MNPIDEAAPGPRALLIRRASGDILMIVAVVILAGVGVVYNLRYLQARNLVDRTRLGYMRTTVHDRLIGSRIDLTPLGAEPTVNGETSRMLLWIIDLERCAGCFDNVDQWTELEQLEHYDFRLLLIGRPTLDVQARLRAMSNTQIRQVSRKAVLASVGATLANTKLLLDDIGIVLLVDSRESGQDCGWNFEAQVAALGGLNASRRIRLPAMRHEGPAQADR